MSVIRQCLGCQATYPLTDHACLDCGSHAGDPAEAEEQDEERAEMAAAAKPKPKPTRRRRT